MQIGRKAAECKTSQDAMQLVQQLDAFRNKGAKEQNDRLSTMQQIIVELYGESLVLSHLVKIPFERTSNFAIKNARKTEVHAQKNPNEQK